MSWEVKRYHLSELRDRSNIIPVKGELILLMANIKNFLVILKNGVYFMYRDSRSCGDMSRSTLSCPTQGLFGPLFKRCKDRE